MSKEGEVKLSHRAKKRIKDVKKKARPGKAIVFSKRRSVTDFFLLFSMLLELASSFMWTELEYAKNFEPYTKFEDNCIRIHGPDVSCEEFIEKYEKNYIPVVISGVQDGWKANSKWVSFIHLL